jgi:voltage-gated potassium channel
MDFTFEFIKMFSVGIFYASPIIGFLLILISILGILAGRHENWKMIDSLYYAFITATTVGYGDFHPEHKPAKLIAIIIAFIGLLLTGIVVAIGLEAAAAAFRVIHPQPVLPG